MGSWHTDGVVPFSSSCYLERQGVFIGSMLLTSIPLGKFGERVHLFWSSFIAVLLVVLGKFDKGISLCVIIERSHIIDEGFTIYI